MKAMILAAGEGFRLRPLTASMPKPMIPIVGVPLLGRTLIWLAAQGVGEAAINLCHRPQSIPDTFGEEYAGIRLHYSFEETLLGTAGGVKKLQALFQDAPFYVIYGDNLISADLNPLREFHEAYHAEATIALFHHPNPSAAGIVSLDAEGRVTQFVEKPPPDQVFSDLANAGVYILNPSVLESISSGTRMDFGRDVFPEMLRGGRRLSGTLLGGYLQDTGTPVNYRQANWDVLAGAVGEDHPDPLLWIGKDVEIGQHVLFHGRNVIGNRVQIGAGASLKDCIIWDDTYIGKGVALEHAILGRGVTIPPGAQVPAGIILGDRATYNAISEEYIIG